ncbi:Protein DDX26B [Sciurus carolinensis]|uniref:Protein DDX26B n=1 Tax=Sciurus carolinensis TaxID=30640 RepID=A0AA41N4B5_SCICA|nr:Protein DDX26B [Sciurus carolinensis]
MSPFLSPPVRNILAQRAGLVRPTSCKTEFCFFFILGKIELFLLSSEYERIFRLLEQVRGSAEVKKQIVEFTIKEAARFKRRDLIKQLEKVLEKTGSHN